jgi:hypothetical protein
MGGTWVGHGVCLRVDFAGHYGVTTKRLNEQVKRNLDRFQQIIRSPPIAPPS